MVGTFSLCALQNDWLLSKTFYAVDWELRRSSVAKAFFLFGDVFSISHSHAVLKACASFLTWVGKAFVTMAWTC
eukprot:891380-Amphidinium_carterae.1